MEGAGERSLPSDDGSKKSSMKIIAVVIVLILIVAAVAGAYVLLGGEDENELPTVSVSTEDLVVQVGDTVTFDASGTEDPDGEIATWTWYFGDGETFDATTTTVTHTYDYPGKYIILLVVEDDSGETAANWDSLVKVEVLGPSVEDADNDTAPIAFAVVDTSEIENGTEVAFDGASSEAFEVVFNENDVENETDDSWDLAQGSDYIATMTWDFGDDSDALSGNFSVAQNGTHVYEGDGVLYASYLEVESNKGATQRYYNTIAVLPEDTGAATGVKNPETFVMASIGEPEYLDPAIDYETAGGEILQNCYETLVWYDGESSATLKGQLATEVPTIANGGITNNGTEYTFTIREGVQFHDGTTMDVYDVEYSLERALTINDGWGPAWMLGQVMIPDYAPDEVLDPQLVDDSVTVDEAAGTVTVHLIQPYPAFIYVMAYTVASVMSDDYVEANGGVTALEHNDHMIENIAGTGPFKLVTWERNQYILLERFDDYWGGAADLKYVIIKKVENVNTREMLLFSGEADCVYIPREHRQDVLDGSGNALSGLRVVEGLPTFNMDFIGFNQNINLTGASDLGMDIGNVPADFFADKNVRLAFVHAFDYDGYIEDVMQNTGEQPNGVIPAGMFAYPEDVPKYDFNVSLAVQYLENTTNPDTGNSYADDGFEITFFYNAGNTVRESACLYLANTMETDVNAAIDGTISIDVQALDWAGAYLPAVRGKVLPIFFLGWAPDYADPDNYVNPFIHQNGTYAKRCGIINQTITDKVEEAAFELNDTLRIQLYEEISMEVYENAFYVWTVQATNFHVEKAWVNGYYFNPMYSGLYYYSLSKG